MSAYQEVQGLLGEAKELAYATPMAPNVSDAFEKLIEAITLIAYQSQSSWKENNQERGK